MSARDKGTGKEQKIRIEASSGLTDAEIEKMKQEAAANAEADKMTKEKVDKMNAADSLIFQTDKQLSEFGDKLSEPNKNAITTALEDLKKAHSEEDLAGIDLATKTLNDAWQAATQEMYAAGATGDATNGAGQQQTEGDDDVTDVDYQEVDGDGK